MITGSYVIEQPKLPIDTGVAVVKFFQKLGYRIEHNSSRRTYEFWYDIYDENGLVTQIDQGVPLDDIIEDLCQVHIGKEPTSKSNYKISGPDTKQFKLLLKYVYDFKTLGILPNGQRTFLF